MEKLHSSPRKAYWTTISYFLNVLKNFLQDQQLHTSTVFNRKIAALEQDSHFSS